MTPKEDLESALPAPGKGRLRAAWAAPARARARPGGAGDAPPAQRSSREPKGDKTGPTLKPEPWGQRADEQGRLLVTALSRSGTGRNDGPSAGKTRSRGHGLRGRKASDWMKSPRLLMLRTEQYPKTKREREPPSEKRVEREWLPTDWKTTEGKNERQLIERAACGLSGALRPGGRP